MILHTTKTTRRKRGFCCCCCVMLVRERETTLWGVFVFDLCLVCVCLPPPPPPTLTNTFTRNINTHTKSLDVCGGVFLFFLPLIYFVFCLNFFWFVALRLVKKRQPTCPFFFPPLLACLPWCISIYCVFFCFFFSVFVWRTNVFCVCV